MIVVRMLCPQSNAEAYLFLLGAPSWAYVGAGLARVSFERLDNLSADKGNVSSPFTVRALH